MEAISALRPPAVVLALCLALFGPAAAATGPEVGPSGRAEATKIIAEMRRIVTDEGVERLEKVPIGGIDQAIAELESLAPYAQDDAPVPLAVLMKQRKWLNFYGGMVHNRTGGQAEAAAIQLAPEYGDRDVAQVWKANDFLAEHLLSDALMPIARPPGDVRTGDVTRFFHVLDMADGAPTAEALQSGYLDAGTDALREFAESRIGSADRLARAIQARPELFARARSCAGNLPRIRDRVVVALDRLGELVPSARFPPVTIVVGRGTTGGVTTPAGVVIGLETLCSADWMQPDITNRFVHLITHEYAHVQQPGAAVEVAEPTVLYQTWLEGGAEFVGELISGEVANVHLQSWVRGRECALEREFLADADSTDLSPWLYNGPGDEARRGDLGYWVGHRLARAYYDRARDKQQAIVEMLSVTPASARTLLDVSGWQPACGPAGGGSVQAGPG